MSRAKKLSEPEKLTVSLPKQHYEYLTYLAWQGRLGNTEPDVAAHILIEEIDRRLVSGYHKIEIPKPTI